VLTARTPIPPRAQWPRDPDGSSRAHRHIRTIRALEAEGVEVLAESVDVADREGMRALVRAARDRFGRIDAVIHAAGVQNPAFFNLAHLTDAESLDAHLRAKVGGFHVLQEVLGDEAAGRRMAFSSLSAVLGGVALGPYAAANAALEAYAHAARAAGRGGWTSVAWDTWRVDLQRLEMHHEASIREFEMAPEEGLQLFERAFGATHLARTVVSTGLLQPRIERWVTGTGKEQGEPAGGGERHPRPDLSTPYVEPEPGVEAAVAAVWAETLGIERVGAHDDFFELGGHSLLAITLATGIRKAVPAAAAIAPTALVVDPTVRALVARIAEDARG
jgi:NAD(P)-dependent dehydrogenase (short-subunit alcohol dehydrogenase family)